MGNHDALTISTPSILRVWRICLDLYGWIESRRDQKSLRIFGVRTCIKQNPTHHKMMWCCLLFYLMAADFLSLLTS